MSADIGALIEKVKRDPEFLALERRRARFAWGLSLAMAAIYFGFILTVAFAPDLLATRIGDGVTTLGIPLGVGVILAAFVLTGLYVRRANTDFDLATERIIERLK
ncbi:DUF485 domain-containing protein [Hyphomicrobium sp. CS1GBMeth3]|uniref:DUF485 domain-containing protein n=1 Tax=Hyphomicrobium sp. CS1GBMeth3 TaxID=1892845 RepID=UPI00093087D0|nr:DUF485 domain-containing protein [Hyphomicrobium sp. CS1GBMeth3]